MVRQVLANHLFGGSIPPVLSNHGLVRKDRYRCSKPELRVRILPRSPFILREIMKCDNCNSRPVELYHHSEFSYVTRKHSSFSISCNILRFHCSLCCTDEELKNKDSTKGDGIVSTYFRKTSNIT